MNVCADLKVKLYFNFILMFCFTMCESIGGKTEEREKEERG